MPGRPQRGAAPPIRHCAMPDSPFQGADRAESAGQPLIGREERVPLT
ncbi:hypothetical protein [Krasilnikovia sp. MM14-A1004]